MARHFGRLAGLLVADVALARGSLREVMTQLCTDMARYPGIRDARWVTARADSRSESPVETLGRWAFLRAGRTAPLSNWWVGCSGRWFRVDHLLPEQLVVLEADGAVKYDNRSDASQVVRDEKERERLLRAAGFGVVRYDHALALRQPQELLRRTDVEAALRIGRPVSATWQQNSPWG